LWEDNTITDIKDSFVCGLDLSRLLAVSVWRGTWLFYPRGDKHSSAVDHAR